MAQVLSRQLVLFGFDLAVIWQYLLLAGSQLLADSGFLARQFQAQIFLWRPRLGVMECYRAGRCIRQFTGEEFQWGANTDAFFAIELPADLVLFRELVVPVKAELYLDEMVRMEVAAATPFSDSRTSAAWRIAARTSSELLVLVAITAEEHLTAARAAWHETEGSIKSTDPEVWALDQNHQAVVFAGDQYELRMRVFRIGVLSAARKVVMVWLLSIGVVLAPAIVGSLRVEQVTEELRSVRADAADETRLADELRAYRERAKYVVEKTRERIDYHYWLNNIAEVTPDDVFLSQLSIEAQSVTVSGFSGNAAAYLGRLTEENGYRDVRASSAFVRDPRTGLERFTISWELASGGSVE